MAKLPEEFAKAIAAAITQNNLENPNVKITLNNDGKNALVPVPHVDGEVVDLDDTKKNDAPIDSESNEEDSELKPETEDNSSKKHHYKSEIISLVCLAAAALGGTWAYTNNHSNNEQKLQLNDQVQTRMSRKTSNQVVSNLLKKILLKIKKLMLNQRLNLLQLI